MKINTTMCQILQPLPVQGKWYVIFRSMLRNFKISTIILSSFIGLLVLGCSFGCACWCRMKRSSEMHDKAVDFSACHIKGSDNVNFTFDENEQLDVKPKVRRRIKPEDVEIDPSLAHKKTKAWKKRSKKYEVDPEEVLPVKAPMDCDVSIIWGGEE